MMVRQRPLTEAERKTLSGIVSWPVFLLFAAFWLAFAPWLLMKLIIGLFWLFGMMEHLPASFYLFLFPWLASAWRFRRSWLRRRPYRDDLRGGVAKETVHELREAIVFPEYEDEGPVIFFRNEDGIFRLCGQELARLENGGFVYEQLIESVAPASGLLLGLRVAGGMMPARTGHCCFTDTPLGKEKRIDLIRTHVLPVTETTWTEIVNSAYCVNQEHPREPYRPDYVRAPVDRIEGFAPSGYVTKEKEILIAKAALAIMAEYAPAGGTELAAQCAMIREYSSESVDEDAFVVKLALPAGTAFADSLKRKNITALAYVNDTDMMMSFALLAGKERLGDRAVSNGDDPIGSLHCGLVQITSRITLETDITNLRFFEVGCVANPRSLAEADQPRQLSAIRAPNP